MSAIFCASVLFLAPSVKPAEIFPVPVKCILRLEYPVVLIREDYQPGRDSHQLGRIVGRHSLVYRYSEVHSPVGHEDRGVPPGDKLVGRPGVMTDGLRRIAPRRSSLADASECLAVACGTDRTFRCTDTRVCLIFMRGPRMHRRYCRGLRQDSIPNSLRSLPRMPPFSRYTAPS